MVTPRRPSRPKPIVVKPARSWQKRSKPAVKPRCVVCGAELRGDHALGDLVCDCHPRDGYNPCQDPHLDEHVFTLLYRARGAPLNLYRALGCESTWDNRSAIGRAVRRLQRSRVVSHHSVGYKVVTSGARRGWKVGA